MSQKIFGQIDGRSAANFYGEFQVAKKEIKIST